MKEKIENAIAILEAEIRFMNDEEDKGSKRALEHAVMVIKANVYDEEDK
jgi:hypothetical protein